MKLQTIRIENFQSIIDSSEFDVGDITCLVGTNESGKTAILKALHLLNPAIHGTGTPNLADPLISHYNFESHYPKKLLRIYKQNEECNLPNVVTATFILSKDDKSRVGLFARRENMPDGDLILTITRGYDNEIKAKELSLPEEQAIKDLISHYKLPDTVSDKVLEFSTAEKILDYFLRNDIAISLPKHLQDKLSGVKNNSLHGFLFKEYLRRRVPKFLYFDKYYRIQDKYNLDTLRERRWTGRFEKPDYPLLGLIDLAGFSLDDLFENDDNEQLMAGLDAASSRLSENIFDFWSNSNHLSIKFEVRSAKENDGPGMTSGRNIFVYIVDTIHEVSTPLGTRSTGFIWFFSFLAWYGKFRKDNPNFILLLDEPGLSLHGKAQADLLAYFEKYIKPHHQIIYTTHSPFMVDPTHFDRVRIVQDLSIESNSENLPKDKQGTEVSTDVRKVESDSIVPLKGALGYEIYQLLFFAPNYLIVEGFSDKLYIRTISAALQRKERQGLNVNWEIIYAGSVDKVSTFVKFIGANPKMNVAVLIDFEKNRHQIIKNLYKEELLDKSKVMTFADFTNTEEADIEDMFDPDFYLKLVNGEFNTSIKLEQLSYKHPRITQRFKKYFEKDPLLKKENFSRNHDRPAKYLSKNISTLEQDLSKGTLDRFQKAFDELNKLL